MKVNRLFLLAITVLAVPSTVHSQRRDAADPIGCGKGHALKELARRGDLPDFRKPVLVAARLGNNDSDVLSNFLQIEAVPSNQTIIGTNLMTIRALSLISEFKFALDSSLAITSVKLNGAPITYTRLNSVDVRANFPSAITTGTTFTLEIAYSGAPTTGTGLGNFTFGTHSGATTIETLSEPYYCNTWWPTKEDNTDKAINDIWVTVPSTLSVAANGLYQGSVTLSGSRKQYKFQGVNPMSPYLLCFAASNFTKFTDTWTYGATTMPLEFYIWPELNTTNNRNAWLNVKQMLTTMSGVYGQYPFANEKYGMYNFSFSGGMEHQTMTGMGGFWESVTVHEMGHQWWGDMITCATWSDIWLNEGFATYTEALWSEKKPGSTGLGALQTAMANRRPSTTNGTVYCFDTTDVNRIFSTNFTYYKPAWVLHMLRHVMGDTKFFQLYTEWRNRYAYSTATSQNFADTASFVYGSDLSWFFDKWLYQVGAPAYQYASSPVVVNGQNYVQVLIKQVQSAAYPYFTMPIDVKVTSGSNSATYVVNNSLPTQYYLVPAPGTSGVAVIDPDTWILATSKTAITYVAGPPKIAQSSLIPNKTYLRPPTSMTVTFQTNVNFNANQVSLTRNGVPLAISATYNSSTKTATVTPTAGRMLAGTYALTVGENITAVDSGQKLDGELFASLPTGDGVAGGATVIPFVVDPEGTRSP